MNGGVIYESAPMVDVLGPEDLLEEVDDPTKLINLTVIVNEKAIVTINGEPTITMGTVRPYIVRGLKPGKKYKFEIEALVKKQKGDEYGAKETVEISAGESKQVVLKVHRQKRTPPPPAPLLPGLAAAAAAAK